MQLFSNMQSLINKQIFNPPPDDERNIDDFIIVDDKTPSQSMNSPE
jgi:hypothetical protein